MGRAKNIKMVGQTEVLACHEFCGVLGPLFVFFVAEAHFLLGLGPFDSLVIQCFDFP